jgi:hypothetical protein
MLRRLEKLTIPQTDHPYSHGRFSSNTVSSGVVDSTTTLNPVPSMADPLLQALVVYSSI